LSRRNAVKTDPFSLFTFSPFERSVTISKVKWTDHLSLFTFIFSFHQHFCHLPGWFAMNADMRDF
jgi:hypothetical protein